MFSQSATSVELLLFDEHDQLEPTAAIRLHPGVNKTYGFWHVYVEGVGPGVHYAFRVDGPCDISGAGHRFDPEKVLIDPYARGNTDSLWDRVAACNPGDNLRTSMRSVVGDTLDYDWEGDLPLKRPMADTVVYELHVGGFTRSPSSGITNPGTFSGIVEKIPYLQQLGVTAVELLPVFEFDDKEVLREVEGKALRNYWGYSTVGFFAPDASYCVHPEKGSHVREFRDMVKALHRAGIEVILDVVFNHTDEGNHLGPTISFKGFDNRTYYILVPWDKQYYMDYTGTGNTVQANHPVVTKFIVECLEYWVREMHVDGFRFDEGSILSRGSDGAPMPYPPVLWQIDLSEALADTKIIAEAWDAGGLYEVGNFPGYRWAEWNGKFRDDLRRFIKGDPGLVGAVASRMGGSADLYQPSGHLPTNSINFVTCHDGFTLYDLVSYNSKHNEANGEGNRDGIDNNLSWNCGAEGDTDDPGILALRHRQIRNFGALLLLARGVPMLLAGDEVGRTQRGNNNAYCQDNEVSWFDWTLTDKHAALFTFFQGMIAFRKRHAQLRQPNFFEGRVNERGLSDVAWHGTRLDSPGWYDPEARVLACTLGAFDGGEDLHILFNTYWQELSFEVPPCPGRRWYRAVDTSQEAAVAVPGQETPVASPTARVEGRSIVVLISR